MGEMVNGGANANENELDVKVYICPCGQDIHSPACQGCPSPMGQLSESPIVRLEIRLVVRNVPTDQRTLVSSLNQRTKSPPGTPET